jgi:hypothetical protein
MGIISNDSGMLILSDAGKPLSLLCCVVCYAVIFVAGVTDASVAESHRQGLLPILTLEHNGIWLQLHY